MVPRTLLLVVVLAFALLASTRAHNAFLFCVSVEGQSEYCGDLTPTKVCLSNGAFGMAFPDNKTVAPDWLTEETFNALQSDEFKSSVCPPHPEMVPVITDRSEFCTSDACETQEDCNNPMFYRGVMRRQCNSFCEACLTEDEWDQACTYNVAVVPDDSELGCTGPVSPEEESSDRTPSVWAIVGAVVVLGLALLGLVGLFGLFFYLNRREQDVPSDVEVEYIIGEDDDVE